jgi:hypothetical protein
VSFLAIPEVLLEGGGALAETAEVAAEAGEVTEGGAAAAEEVTSTSGEIERGARIAEEHLPSSSSRASEEIEEYEYLDVSIRGADKVEHDLLGISRRADNLSPVFRKEMRMLERREMVMFAGKYVDTGRLRASLTQESAPGAVREILPNGFKFGSSIWYGKYQVVNPGPETENGGLRRAGHESAVMHKLSQSDCRKVTEEVGGYIMQGQKGMVRL